MKVSGRVWGNRPDTFEMARARTGLYDLYAVGIPDERVVQRTRRWLEEK